MTKQELFDEVNKKISYYDEQLNNPPLKYKFYADFVDNNNLKSIKAMVDINPVDLAIALMYPAFEDDTDFEEISDDVKSFCKVFENLTSDEIAQVDQMMNGFFHTGHFKVVESIYNDDNKRRAIKDLREIFTDSRIHASEIVLEAVGTLERLITNNKENGWNISMLLYYYKVEPVATSNIMNVIGVLKELKENDDFSKYSIKEINERKNVQNILMLGNSIIECRRVQREVYKKTEDRLKGQRGIYKKFLKNMEEAFSKEEIKNYELIIKDIDEEELKVAFLKLVYQHNKIKYDEIDAVHENLTRNSLVNYLEVLRNNGIKKDAVDLNKLMRNSCEDLDKMLKILNSIVVEKDIVIRIAENSDLANVSYFKELKTKGILSTGAFIKYPEIFTIDSDFRKMLDKNIQVINDFEIDSTLFSKSSDVLIENTNFEDNLRVLRTYKLIDGLKNIKKYSFLKSDNLSEKIDKILELGYEDLLVEDISLLNEDNWDRIYVLKSMGLQPTDKLELVKYLRSNKFFASDDKLNLYIESVSDYYDGLDISYETDMSRIINDYSNTERTLDFNGVIISKNRVSRNLISDDFDINDLFNAVIKNSILSMEEIETIKSILKSKIYKLD